MKIAAKCSHSLALEYTGGVRMHTHSVIDDENTPNRTHTELNQRHFLRTEIFQICLIASMPSFSTLRPRAKFLARAFVDFADIFA